ncbi:PEGA domain-containing protein, partial [Candidatus Methanophagaceae archaeon]
TTVASLTVTPPSVNVGDFVIIEGAGFGANETLTLSCHVSDLEVPVSGNKYEYSLNELNLSNSNTSFSLSVREVEDDTEVHIKKQGLPVVVINKDSPSKLGFEFDYNATTHTSTVSAPMPIDPSYTGIYELIEVSGTVVGNTTEVFMDLTVDNSVTTDATGYFKTVIDTHGFPPQEYTITADGVAATLTVCHLIVPDHAVMEGELVTIEGEGFGANETLILSSQSNFTINVSGSEYEYTLKEFNLSDPNTGFSLSVREVKDDMEIQLKKQGGTKIFVKDDKYGFKFDYDSTTNTATVSVPMPIDPSYTGIYEFIEVSGTAFGGTSNVYMDIRVINSVTTTESGYFETVIDTHGFPPHEYTITATSATASAKATLTIIPATGSIAVTSSPTGAAIELDGNSTHSKTNATISDVSPGTHSIKLTLDGYQSWSENVPVQAGETYYVNATLTPNPTPTPAPRGCGGGGGGGGGGPADTDGDGYCNIDETIMGTDPEDPCDPDPNCVACQALVGTHILPPVVEQTPRPTSTIKYLTTPTPRPKPTPAATPTPTPKPLLPILGPDKPIILIVIIVAVSVLIAALFFLHRKFKSVDTENHDSDRIVWR